MDPNPEHRETQTQRVVNKGVHCKKIRQGTGGRGEGLVGTWLVRQVSVRQQAGSQAAAMNKTMVKNYGAQELL